MGRRGVVRLAAVFAASAAVVAGATACNVQPGAAAFIGGDRITQAQVDDVFQSIIDAPAYSGVKTAAEDDRQRAYANLRTNAAGELIMHQLTQRVAADQHIEIPPADYATLARQSGLPEDNKFLRLEAENEAAINTLRNAAWNTPPDDKTVRAIYDSLAQDAANHVDATTHKPAPLQLNPYEQLAPELKKTPKVGQTAALRGTFQAAIKKYHVDVNPRYGKLEFPMTALTVPAPDGTPLNGSIPLQLGKGAPTVVKTVRPGTLAG